MFNQENNTVATYIDYGTVGNISDEFQEALYCLEADAQLLPEFKELRIWWPCLLGPLDATYTLYLDNGITDANIGELIEELNELMEQDCPYMFELPTLEVRS